MCLDKLRTIYMHLQKQNNTEKKKLCYDVLDMWHFAENFIMILKSRYVRRLDLQHTRRMGWVVYLQNFVREHRGKRHWVVWYLKFQVDLQYFVRALTLFDYRRIHRRIVNHLFEASNIRHLRSSGMLCGMGS